MGESVVTVSLRLLEEMFRRPGTEVVAIALGPSAQYLELHVRGDGLPALGEDGRPEPVTAICHVHRDGNIEICDMAWSNAPDDRWEWYRRDLRKVLADV